jgi:hypothetical protein
MKLVQSIINQEDVMNEVVERVFSGENGDQT